MGVELAPVEAALDCIHQPLPTNRDQNAYTLGEFEGHNVVIAILPTTGTNATAAVTNQLLNDFPSVRFGLLVGIGGGVPGDHGEQDVRLGDIVVGQPTDTLSAVVQYDLGKRLADGTFKRTGQLNKPPSVLSANVRKLQAQHAREGNLISNRLHTLFQRYPQMRAKYSFPSSELDQLFPATYKHRSGKTCAQCKPKNAIKRPRRPSNDPVIHYGTIGSANLVVKDAVVRDELRRDTNVLCVEMEAAGVADNLPCLVIRGICDYADSHKNKACQPYAAAVAAAYMMQLLSSIPIQEVVRTQTQHLTLQNISEPYNEYFEVPHLLSTVFTGQFEILQRLDDSLAYAPLPRVKVQRRFVLFGLGGSGKTQISLKYAQTHRERYWAIFWVDASSHESILQSVTYVASLLQVEPIIDGMKRFLANTSQSWLLVFDNADNPDLSLNNYFPRGDRGDIIITSRDPGCRSYQTVGFCQLGAMLPEDSQALLSRMVSSSSDAHEKDSDVILQVVQTLGHLALAVAQAGAYIRETSCTLREYLKLYQRHQRELLEYHPRHSDTDYQHTVFTMWQVSLEQIRSRKEPISTLAVEMLKLVCFYHHDHIPLALFDRAWSNHWEDTQTISIWPDATSDLSDIQYLVQASTLLLASFSLVTRDSQDSLSLHPLMRDMYQVTLVGDRPAGYLRAISLLGATVSRRYDDEDYAYRRSLTPHVRPVLGFCMQEGGLMTDGSSVSLWSPVALILSENGFVNDAVWVSERVVKKIKSECGEMHPRTFDSMHRLAIHYRRAGRLHEALLLAEQVVELWESEIGETHPDTLGAIHNLACIYSDLGREEEAIRLFDQVVELHKKRYGEAHPHTLRAVNDLVILYGHEGRQEALELAERAMVLCETNLGENHPDTLYSMHNLASSYMDSNRWEEARELLEQVVELRKSNLGETHPETLASMERLGDVYANEGRHDESCQLLERALELRERQFGKTHPRTIDCMYNLVVSYMSTGRQEEALKLSENTIECAQIMLNEGRVDSSYVERLLEQVEEASSATKQLQPSIDGTQERDAMSVYDTRKHEAKPRRWRQRLWRFLHYPVSGSTLAV